MAKQHSNLEKSALGRNQSRSRPEKLIPIEHEIADVFIYLIRIANKMGIDVEDAVYKKLELNKLKYPIEDNRGVVNKI